MLLTPLKIIFLNKKKTNKFIWPLGKNMSNYNKFKGKCHQEYIFNLMFFFIYRNKKKLYKNIYKKNLNICMLIGKSFILLYQNTSRMICVYWGSVSSYDDDVLFLLLPGLYLLYFFSFHIFSLKNKK